MGVLDWFRGPSWAAVDRALAEAEAPRGAKYAPPHQFLRPTAGRPRVAMKPWGADRAVKDGYKGSSWVYACIDRLVKAVASTGWVAQRRATRGWEPAPNSPLQLLLDEPCPAMSRQTYWARQVQMLYLTGNGVSVIVEDGRGRPAELWPLDSRLVHALEGDPEIGPIGGYEYKTETGPRVFEPEQIAHLLFPDPDSAVWGMAPLEAAAKAVDTDAEAREFALSGLQNRAVVDGLISFKEPLSREQHAHALEMWQARHAGPANARGTAILGSDARFAQMSMSPAEMDFIESRRLTREEICAIFQVPPPLVGIYDNATLANIQIARFILWVDTVIPLLDDLSSALTTSVARRFGREWRVGYDVSHVDVLLEITQRKMAIADSLFAKGVPMSEIDRRLSIGLEAYDGWDVGYLASGLLPAGTGGLFDD